MYDVAALEALWGIEHDWASADFHARVIAARCAGLAELDARLRGGPRPAEARLHEADYVPLPPSDTERATHIQLGSHDREGELPAFEHRDARAMVGHEQPVALPHGRSPSVQAGLAVVLAEDLWRAGAREASQAILGSTLLLDWASDGAGPSQLGPDLLVSPRPKDIIALRALFAGTESPLADPFLHPAEALAYLSQHVHLGAGDVVGLGALRGAGHRPAFGERVAVELPRIMRLSGWATAAPPPASWRF
jgi:hypothetical protein